MKSKLNKFEYVAQLGKVWGTGQSEAAGTWVMYFLLKMHFTETVLQFFEQAIC